MKKISCTGALAAAWDRMLEILFRPFDFAKWCSLGFCAWLAFLFERVSGNVGFNFSSGFNGGGSAAESRSAPGNVLPDLSWESIRGFLKRLDAETQGLLLVILCIAAFVFAATVVISIAAMWIKSRGEFMFIHNIAGNYRTPRISEPWKKFRKEGNSLFAFRFCLTILSWFVFLLFAASLTVLGWHWFGGWIKTSIHRGNLQPFNGLMGLQMTFLALMVLAYFAFSILLSLFWLIFRHAAIPVMYRQGVSALQACAVVWRLIKSSPSAFIIYVLLYICIKTAVFIALFVLNLMLMIIGLLTCCLAFIVIIPGMFILALPYVWAVIFLPVLTFIRCFSLEFMARFGDEYSVFAKTQG